MLFPRPCPIWAQRRLSVGPGPAIMAFAPLATDRSNHARLPPTTPVPDRPSRLPGPALPGRAARPGPAGGPVADRGRGPTRHAPLAAAAGPGLVGARAAVG